jgi:hypothetical protein
LRKAVTNDRSSPIVGGNSNSAASSSARSATGNQSNANERPNTAPASGPFSITADLLKRNLKSTSGVGVTTAKTPKSEKSTNPQVAPVTTSSVNPSPSSLAPSPQAPQSTVKPSQPTIPPPEPPSEVQQSAAKPIQPSTPPPPPPSQVQPPFIKPSQVSTPSSDASRTDGKNIFEKKF